MSPGIALQGAGELFDADSGALARTVRALAAFVLVYLVGQFVISPAILELVRARNRRNPTVVSAIEGYVRVAVLLAAGLAGFVAAGFGHVLSGSALVIAALTLAVGVAGQAVVGNLVAGLFLVADPDFNVGDWISWSEGEGTVEEVRFRVTRVRTPNNEVITVPNTALATNAVTRPYGRDRFRIIARLGVSYDDSLDEAMAALRKEAEDVPEVLADPTPTVLVDGFADDAVRLEAVFWIERPTRGDVRRVRSTFIERVKARFEEEGITISPPSEHDISGRLEVASEDG